MKQHLNLCFLALFLFGLTFQTKADDMPESYFDMSLEELINIEVFSLERRSQSLKDSPAAIFVLTSEDIRRSGVNSIPEALRLVPGMHVQRIDANSWAVSIRGFTGKYVNKILVLIDGRSIYNPNFSGVFWDSVDLNLPDIDRIEIIRGPGGSIWGANAVNGIINIVRKNSADTIGTQVELASGNEDHGVASIRHGERISDSGSYRIYTKALFRDGLRYKLFHRLTPEIPTTDLGTGMNSFTSGARYDSVLKSGELMLQADLQFLRANAINTAPTVLSVVPSNILPTVDDLSAKNLSVVGRWSGTFNQGGDYYVQTYFSRNDRGEGGGLDLNVTTFDIDSQSSLNLSSTNTLQFGLGHRQVQDDLESIGHAFIDAQPRKRSIHFSSAYIQDQQALADDKLRLSVGTKFTHNTYSQLDVQPSARAIITLNEQSSLWGSVSEAVRVPSRVDTDYFLIGGTIMDSDDTVASLAPSGTDKTSSVRSYELGYRYQEASFSVDSAFFYNSYKNLSRAIVTEFPRPTTLLGQPTLELPLVFTFDGEAQTYGMELVVDTQILDAWRAELSYSYLRTHFRVPSSVATSGLFFQLGAEHIATLRSLASLSESTEFDATLRFVDSTRTPEINGMTDYASPVLQLDLRLGYQLSDSLDLSLTGRNLLGGKREHSDTTSFTYSAATEPAFILRASQRF